MVLKGLTATERAGWYLKGWLITKRQAGTEMAGWYLKG